MADFMNRILSGCASLLVVLSLAAPAFGQFGGNGPFGGADGPQVNRAQLETYAELLDLDATQRDVATMMLEEYIASVQTQTDELREAGRQARQEFEETRDRSAFQDLREVRERTSERLAELESRFMEDLKLLLTPEQESSWPRVEMAHRRATSLPRGLMSGERVDLFEIVKGLDLQGEAANEAQAVLTDYALTLDQALIARNEMYEQGLEMIQNRDFEALQSHFEDAREASIRVRDTHTSFARRLEAVIPQESLPMLESAIRQASFPTVYRSTQAERALEMAKGLESLSEDQRSRIEAIALATDRRMTEVNRKLADEIESNETSMTLRDMMGRGRGGRGVEDGTRELFREKRDIVDQTLDQIRSVLTEEQAASLEEAIGSEQQDQDRAGPRSRREMRGAERGQRRQGEL